jgi:hypothetical protein
MARQVEVEGKTVWIDMNRGAAQHCSALVALCEDRGIDPSAIKVKLSR